MFGRIQNQRLALVARTWIVPTILVVVAMIHMTQWRTEHRSSWGTGAGFGMFATVDSHGSRFYRCYGTTELGTLRMKLPRNIFENSGLRARAIPSKNNLKKVIQQLSQEAWSVRSDDSGVQYLSTQKENKEEDHVPIGEIRLEIWGIKIDAAQKRLVSFKVNEASTESEARYVASR